MSRGDPTIVTLEQLAGRFDVFFVDQFGVLHDGETSYDGAIDALKYLKSAGKQVVLISNSGKRSAPNEDRLEALGFARDSFDFVLSSGEVAWHLLADEMIGDTIPAGGRCLLLSRDNGGSAIDGLDLTAARDGTDADVVILAGSRGDEWEMADYEALLAPAAARDVPCLCSNPDKTMLTRFGPRFGAGAIAETYARLGGHVIWIGKPYPEIYRGALAALGNPKPSTVCCIGDSIEHDIAGGAGAGISTALVRSGIHAGADMRELAELFATHGATPDFVIAEIKGAERRRDR